MSDAGSAAKSSELSGTSTIDYVLSLVLIVPTLLIKDFLSLVQFNDFDVTSCIGSLTCSVNQHMAGYADSSIVSKIHCTILVASFFVLSAYLGFVNASSLSIIPFVRTTYALVFYTYL